VVSSSAAAPEVEGSNVSLTITREEEGEDDVM